MDKIKPKYCIGLLCLTLALFHGLFVAADEIKWNNFSYPIDRYKRNDAINIADNMVAFQRETGGWGKNLLLGENYSSAELAVLMTLEKSYSLLFDQVGSVGEYSHKSSTLDNGATHSHIRFLLRAALVTKKRQYVEAVNRGLVYLLNAQTDAGGWAQNYPNSASYGGHITFNDGAMAGALTALQEALDERYGFISTDLRVRIAQAVDRGVGFIVQSQIVVNGKKTVWSAQHNRTSYQPEGGRVYELPSLSGLESVGIVKVLMRVNEPNDAVKSAVVAAIRWFDEHKIDDLKVKKIYDKEYGGTTELLIGEDPNSRVKKRFSFTGIGYDKVVVKNIGRPIWARFYDLETQEPIFVGWDGVKRFSLSEIDYERRVGYLWYGYWPETLLKENWPNWQAKWL